MANDYCINYFSKELLNNKDIMFKAVKQNGELLLHASKKLKNDGEANRNNEVVLDKDIVMEAVKTSFWALQYALINLKNNEEIVLEAVKHDGRALEYTSDELQNNDFIIKNAVENCFLVEDIKQFQYIPEVLRNNEKFLLNCIKINHNIFNTIDKKFKRNMDFVIKAFLINNKINIRTNFKYNDSFWFKIIKQNKDYIEYLPVELKNDNEFMNLIKVNC